MSTRPGGPRSDDRGAGRAATAAAALRLFRERGWLGALAGVVVLSAAFVWLGGWQFERHEQRVARAELVAANYDAAPVPLGTLLPAGGPALRPADEWRRVRVSGSYLAGSTLLVRNRPREGNAGYEVLVPLRLSGGDVLLVDRGWVPAGATASGPADVPPPPAGEVVVEARLRPGEPGDGRRAPAGQVTRIDLAAISATLGTEVAGAYGVLAAEQPAATPAPRALPRPETTTDINLPYAVQWYAFAAAAYVLLAVGAVREVRRRGGGAGAGDRPARTRRPTDAEAEDALLDG